VIYRYFSKTNRLYLKSIADIVLIGVLIHLMKDYGQFFYALYFLPIAAAALSLQLINALLIGTAASLLVAAEIYFSAENILPAQTPAYHGAWQIAFILFVTFFCRMLAVQLRQEQQAKDESLARQKVLEEEALRQREFLSLTSHQLYTPTSIIRGFASNLRQEDDWKKLTPEQQDAIQEIHASSKRMTALVKELLSVSKMQGGHMSIKPKTIDLKKLLENIVKQFNIIVDKDKSLALVCPDNLREIHADPERLRDVINNFIDNALKYAKNGTIKITVWQNDKDTIVSIKDDGVGVPPEDHEKLFQPFFRGKNILELDNKGTGLGLYIARLIIEAHKGRIWLEESAKGSDFRFSLPR